MYSFSVIALRGDGRAFQHRYTVVGGKGQEAAGRLLSERVTTCALDAESHENACLCRNVRGGAQGQRVAGLGRWRSCPAGWCHRDVPRWPRPASGAEATLPKMRAESDEYVTKLPRKDGEEQVCDAGDAAAWNSRGTPLAERQLPSPRSRAQIASVALDL
jgi:hypothetical protein